MLEIWLNLSISFDDDMLFRQLKNFRQLRTVSLVIWDLADGETSELINAQTADSSPIVIEFPNQTEFAKLDAMASTRTFICDLSNCDVLIALICCHDCAPSHIRFFFVMYGVNCLFLSQ